MPHAHVCGTPRRTVLRDAATSTAHGPRIVPVVVGWLGPPSSRRRPSSTPLRQAAAQLVCGADQLTSWTRKDYGLCHQLVWMDAMDRRELELAASKLAYLRGLLA